MVESIIFDVSDEDVALEVANGIMERAEEIHNNSDDDFEEVAEELREVGQELAAEYRNSVR